MDSNGPPLILCGFPMVSRWFPLWFSFQYSSDSFKKSLQSHILPIRFLLIFQWCPNGFPNGFPSGSPFVFPMFPLLVFIWFPLWFPFSFLLDFFVISCAFHSNCPLVSHCFPKWSPSDFLWFPNVFRMVSPVVPLPIFFRFLQDFLAIPHAFH